MSQIISSYIGILIMTIGIFLFARIVINKKIEISKIKLILLIFFVAIIYTITYLNSTGILKTSIIFLITVFFYKYIFKISIHKSIITTFLYVIILIIPDLLSLFFFTNIMNVSKNYYYEEFAGSILGNVTTLILFLIIINLIKKPLRKLFKEKIDNNKVIIFYAIFVFVCTGLFFYTIIKKFKFSNDVVLYLIAIVLLVAVLFSLIKQTIKNNKLMNEYDKLLEFMVTYENEIENQRILRHEVKNEFRTIRAKICDNQENKEIIEYIDEIVNDKYEVNKEKYAKFGYLPPNGIKGLCYFKTQEAEDKKIKVSINISKRVKNSTIYDLTLKEQRDFGRILGVFLDNAIEASIESKEKQIGIEAYTNTKKEFKMIITNTYNNTIDKNKIGKENFSTKGKSRGHGLLLVNQLVGKNKKLEIKTDIQENIYTQVIEIKKL